MALTRTSTVSAILAVLSDNGSTDNLAGMARYGIRTDRAFGVPNSLTRPMAKALGPDHERAMALWETGWREARLIAAWTAEPGRITPGLARSWADGFDSWDIVDGVADILADTPLWCDLVHEFAADERLFVRRAGFAIIAWAALHRRKEPNATFIGLLELIERYADDDRNFVKKAVSWALRGIGKRSHSCHSAAMTLAENLLERSQPSARWIGRDALKDLSGPAAAKRLSRRAVPD